MQGDNGDEDGFIIITGGCDSLNGNEKLAVNADFAACMSTSKATFKFDPFENSFERMEDSKYERQRHTAVVMDGELYVFGGRDTDDNLVAEIEVSIPSY